MQHVCALEGVSLTSREAPKLEGARKIWCFHLNSNVIQEGNTPDLQGRKTARNFSYATIWFSPPYIRMCLVPSDQEAKLIIAIGAFIPLKCCRRL